MLPHREHQQRADALRPRDRKHVPARALVHHVEAHHEHLPDRIVHRALQHRVGEIDDRVLGDADVPDLALLFLLEQRRRDRLERIVVFVDLDAMQIEHVDMIGAHQAERIVEAATTFSGGAHGVAAELRLGGDHDLVARDGLQRLPDHALGAVARRGVDEVDAEPDRLVDQPRGFVLGSCRPSGRAG